MNTKIEVVIDTPEFFYSHDTCRYCGKKGKHWSLVCPQGKGTPEAYKPPQPSLEEAKQRFLQAKQWFEEAENELKTAKGVLARVIYDEQVKLDAIKKTIFGEIPDPD